nr:formylglycine-generating enzyme family protein [Myxococcota bacterium]
ALLAAEDATPPMRGAGQAALARLAVDGALDPRHEALFDGQLAGLALTRAVVRGLPADRREAFALAQAPTNTRPMAVAVSALQFLQAIRDLVDTPALASRRAAYLDATKTHHFHHVYVERERTPMVAPEVSRPTDAARGTLKQALEDLAKERRLASLGPLVERAWSERAITVDAPELASMDAWRGASDERRRAIADDVARAVGGGCTVAGIESFTDGELPVAVLAIGEERFSLVPGGTVEVGFSEEEERLVREAAGSHAEEADYEEQYGHLLQAIPSMRPVTVVTVGPLLAAQCPGTIGEPLALIVHLESSLFRAPSEAEWEHLARGGRRGEPTFRGPSVPDTAAWFEATRDLSERGSNAFGMWELGFHPELCADAFHPTHDGLPTNGSPRIGPGPRTSRGGAAQLYPWQGCGEWRLLLTAMRAPHTSWPYALCVRPTISVHLGAP